MQNILSQVIDTPLLMHRGKLDNIMSWLGPRIVTGADFSAAIQAEQVEHRSNSDYVVADGVAIIPVIGSLVYRGRSMNSSGMTAYQALDANLTMAMNDSAVKSILLDIDSPGGQVSGCFDFAERLIEMRQSKRIVAVANDLAASAAYAIGSAASELVVTQTAAAGSIGVVMAHVDYSKNMAENGVGVTYVYAGDHKVDGNPYEPLPADVKADMQEEINGIYELFTSHVATARGMKQKDVIATQARVFIGQKAVDAGLADRVGTIESEFARLKAAHSTTGAGSRRFATRHQEVSMTKETTVAPSQSAGAAVPASPAAAQTAVTEITDAEYSAAIDKATQAGVAEERARCLSIFSAGKDLGLDDSVMTTQIEQGASADTANQVMLAIKSGIDASVQVNTQHSAGANSAEPKSAEMPSYGEIYGKRNAG